MMTIANSLSVVVSVKKTEQNGEVNNIWVVINSTTEVTLTPCMQRPEI